jgi:hypothetical protein
MTTLNHAIKNLISDEPTKNHRDRTLTIVTTHNRHQIISKLEPFSFPFVPLLSLSLSYSLAQPFKRDCCNYTYARELRMKTEI